jgi:hypothetical protein
MDGTIEHAPVANDSHSRNPSPEGGRCDARARGADRSDAGVERGVDQG